MLSLDLICHRKLSLGQLAYAAFPNGNFDTAKPQSWLDTVASASETLSYHEINATVVWYYPTKEESQLFWLLGIPGVLCEETARELDRQGIPYWTERGYHGQPLDKQRAFFEGETHETN